MKLCTALLVALALAIMPVVVPAQVSAGNGNGWVQAYACGSNAIPAGSICTGTGVPSNNCSVGAVFIRTDGAVGTVEYYCSSANTWSAIASGTCTGGTNISITSTCTINLVTPLTTALIVGPGAPSCPTVGQVCSSIGVSSGQFSAGGSSTRGDLDYGVHHSAIWTLTPSLNVSDKSTARLNFNATGTNTYINAENDAASGNVPLTLSGFSSTGVDSNQGSTLKIDFAATNHTGPIQSAATSSAAMSYDPPFYLANGTAVASTMHCVRDTVTAGGISTTVTLTAPAAFASTDYLLYIENLTSLSAAVITAQAAGSFTFTSVSTNVYKILACGA